MSFFRNYVEFEISGENTSKLINFIFKNNIPCKNLVNKGNILCGIINRCFLNTLLDECKNLGLELSYTQNINIFLILKWLLNRKGLVLGFVCGLVCITILSNMFLQLRIKSDNQNLCKKLEEYIHSKGFNYGDFIPKMDLYSLELDILKEVDEVSWVGIYITGGTLNVDLVENIDKPEYNQKRLPSNLYAKCDGQIVNTEIFGGKLVVPVGSGVHKGQLLVSGEVALNEEMTVFRRSQGKIYAKVSYQEDFFCPYENQQKIVSDKHQTKNYLGFYSLKIPLGLKNYNGQYIVNENKTYLNFLNLKLPISYISEKYYPYSFEKKTLNENEATEKVKILDDNYKQNFLSECEIIDEKEKLTILNDGVRLTKIYTVIENIAIEKEFLVK